jgi:hypothetical protein
MYAPRPTNITLPDINTVEGYFHFKTEAGIESWRVSMRVTN